MLKKLLKAIENSEISEQNKKSLIELYSSDYNAFINIIIVNLEQSLSEKPEQTTQTGSRKHKNIKIQ